MGLFGKIKGLIKSTFNKEKGDDVKKEIIVQQEPEIEKSNEKNALLLTSGGMKCITQCVYLEKIAKELEGKQKRFSDVFDLISGVGVGGVIALMLALHDSASEISRAVYAATDGIFTEQKGGILRLAESRYSDSHKYEFFDNIFAEKTLGDLKIDVAVLALDKDKMEPLVFTKDTFGHLKLKELSMALTAEPVYFMPYKLKLGDGKCNMISANAITSDSSLYAIKHLKEKYGDAKINLIALSSYKNPPSFEKTNSQKDWQSEEKTGFTPLQRLYGSLNGTVSKEAAMLLCEKYMLIENKCGDYSDTFELDSHSISAIERLREIAKHYSEKTELEEML